MIFGTSCANGAPNSLPFGLATGGGSTILAVFFPLPAMAACRESFKREPLMGTYQPHPESSACLACWTGPKASGVAANPYPVSVRILARDLDVTRHYAAARAPRTSGCGRPAWRHAASPCCTQEVLSTSEFLYSHCAIQFSRNRSSAVLSSINI